MHTLVGNLYERAVEAGANCIVVSCQMCQANLDMYQHQIVKELGKPYYLPILYFTELIGLALGIQEAKSWTDRHFVQSDRLFNEAGLSV